MAEPNYSREDEELMLPEEFYDTAEEAPESMPMQAAAAAPVLPAANPNKKSIATVVAASEVSKKSLYMSTVAAANNAPELLDAAFIRVPTRQLTGHELLSISNLDLMSSKLTERVAKSSEQPQVCMTNVAHWVHKVSTCVEFEFTIREIMELLGGAPQDVHTTAHTEVCAFHAGVAEVCMEHAFDLDAAKVGANEEASSSNESAYAIDHKDRPLARLVYSEVVATDEASSAIMYGQSQSKGVAMGRVMFTGVSMRSCDTQFPFPLKIRMTGVADNFHAKYGKCAARISSGGVIMTALPDGSLQVLRHSCTDEELASFMDMDPEREIAYVFKNGADANRTKKYHLTPKLLLFVELYLLKRYKKRYGSVTQASARLKALGVTIGYSKTASYLLANATAQGLGYILREARALRAKMPMYKSDRVMVSIEPDVEGGWRGLAAVLASRKMAMFTPHESLEFMDIPFTVSLHLDMAMVPPDAQHERVEAFAEMMAAHKAEQARMTVPTPVVMQVTAPMPPPAPVIAPEVLAMQQKDPLAAALLAASLAHQVGVAAPVVSSRRSGNSGKKSKSRRK